MIKLSDCKDFKTAIAFLDQEFGKDWFQQINLDKLDIYSEYNCIIGQLYPKGGYFRFLDNKGIDYLDALGTLFTHPSKTKYNTSENLTQWWKAYILALRGGYTLNFGEGRTVDAVGSIYNDGSSREGRYKYDLRHIYQAANVVGYKPKEFDVSIPAQHKQVHKVECNKRVLVGFTDGTMQWVDNLSDIPSGIKFKVKEN